MWSFEIHHMGIGIQKLYIYNLPNPYLLNALASSKACNVNNLVLIAMTPANSISAFMKNPVGYVATSTTP